ETIPNLERQKKNLYDDDIRKLQYTIEETLQTKKLKLEERIEDLKYKISSLNVQNSSLVGEYVIHDYPAKPKKKLIVVVAFITGFILSIFLVFFLEFVKGFRLDEDTKAIEAK
ncbi:MAG: hypothetical protein OQK11_06115, partial [Thiovulaceae bacterium]|nr:hypothetical protein [Sulfurimonadaceae bacterium]